jgi:hypothetical protein
MPRRDHGPALLAMALLLSGCHHNPAASSLPPEAPPGAEMLWPVPKDMANLISQAGLPAQATELTTYHIHVHLDVFKDGQQVVVPANVGIVTGVEPRLFSPLHTHLAAGVIHVEYTEKEDFKLGQFFTEWNVPLTGATAYVNGQQAPDPANIILDDLQEIAIVYGTPPAKIPKDLYGN